MYRGMMRGADDNQADFRDALMRLENGDFSRLDPLFAPDLTAGGPSRMVLWHEIGLFQNQAKALAEALTCACFLGRTETAEYLLRQGVPPSGGAQTGLNALHWAANRGEVEAVKLLIRWKCPLEPQSMYGGNALDTAVWSAINEPRTGQIPVIEELLKAGARPRAETFPTGRGHIDAILRPYLSD